MRLPLHGTVNETRENVSPTSGSVSLESGKRVMGVSSVPDAVSGIATGASPSDVMVIVTV